MRESDKGAKGDHRQVSDPIKERKDFIEHLKKNAPVNENKKTQQEQPGVQK